ncbi:MAG TPA: response regulator transcription factor [Roseiarcus sp.]|nr:response regulator transcription factor [Roseiarcus sp.]
MGNEAAFAEFAEMGGATQSLEFAESFGVSCVTARVGVEVTAFIAIVESRTFLRECIRRSMQSAFSFPVVTYSTLSELERQLGEPSAGVVILSLMEASAEASANALKELSEISPHSPVVVLASRNDADLARTAIRHGAKGYIPVTMGFEVAIEAVRFVMAGGSYAPVDCLLATAQPCVPAAQTNSPSGVLTGRELSVVHAIQQGKSNKVIAYELNMCESTVKVHVRNVMKKLKAKNRTDVAIKAQTAAEHQLAQAAG